MPEIDFRSASTTSIEYPWPPSITGVERVMLASQGDLQRQLSAFFARPIDVQVIYSHTRLPSIPNISRTSSSLSDQTAVSSAVASASANAPVVQKRQVKLLCAGKTVCTATSTVSVKSPEAASLLLEKRFAIGQLFRELGTLPKFELEKVGFGRTYEDVPEFDVEVNKSSSMVRDSEELAAGDELWRTYRLSVSAFETDILEVFPSRKMFTQGIDWATNNREPMIKVGRELSYRPQKLSASSVRYLLAFVFGIVSEIALLSSLEWFR